MSKRKNLKRIRFLFEVKVIIYSTNAITNLWQICSFCVVKKTKKAPRKFVFDEEGLKLLAKRLKELRSEKGFTQEDLAYESELSLSQIARIETVKINPTVSTMFIIARTLNIPVSALFDFKLSNKRK